MLPSRSSLFHAMHRLSIVIVNYRVPLLLGQCLESVAAAITEIDAEVWVVDNASGDNSIEYLRPRFPWVNFIENEQNLGFSKANNLAIERSQSEYVLLLNPDTIIAEDTLTECLRHMDTHPRCSALGAKMHNIHGRYLRESKRGFPSTWVSFCKLSGLTRLFPKSKLFARYYMGHLDETRWHSVQVLSGAFMMMRSRTLRHVGLLDERFFMYGEDVDLSYRIVLNGQECHYFPTPMIHYKGESSILDSAKYIKSFYGAMQLFFEKYYIGKFNRFGRHIVVLSINLVSAVAKVKAKLSRPKTQVEPPKPIPCTLPLTGDLPPVGAHILIDRTKYSFGEIIRNVVLHAERGYSYHFINSEGQIISPRR